MSPDENSGPARASLRAGSRLGTYELLGPLAAGGMGEVWRARDARLGREVALKILPGELAENRERRRRFEQEARSASALNHPNIVTVYDVGSEGGVSYLAMELVAGRTLRDLCAAGPLPVRKLLDVALQIARGLARAHASGIVHRDLKPDNVMVASDGAVKILDFGLAKLVRSPVESDDPGREATVSTGTEPGVLLGTYGYMSPEQASGRPVDFRSDQFSFGSVLYEMATGQKAFRRDTAVDTLSAVLHDEPEPIVRSNPKAPAPLRWIVERCHVKDPKDRYASTDDLAREIQSLREHLSDLSGTAALSFEEPAPGSPFRVPAALAAAAGLALLAAAAGFLAWRSTRTEPPRFHQLTLQGGAITTARFTPGGQSVVYATQWEGRRPELFETRLEHPESRPLGLPAGQIHSISRSGYMAVGLLPSWGMTLRSPSFDLTDRFPPLLFGTLAQVPLAGGTPRELLDGVSDADWTPDGKELAVVRFAGGMNRLEFPIGRRIHEHFGWIAFPRVSPDGKRIAFSEMDSSLSFADRAGNIQATGISVWEHAWSPATGEVLYIDYRGGTSELRAMSPSGRQRALARFPGYFTIYDVSESGAVLLGQVTGRDEVLAGLPGEKADRPLFGDATLEDVSAAGDLATFAGGTLEETPTAFLGRMDGSPPKRLGALGGYARALLTPDGKFVLGQSSPDGLAVLETDRAALVMVPVGAGETIRVPTTGLSNPKPEGFAAGGRRIYVSGVEPGHGPRLWLVDLPSGRRTPASPEGVRSPKPSPDGQFAVGHDTEGWRLFPDGGGAPRKVPGILPGEEPIQWTADGHWLYVRRADELRPGERYISARVDRLDPWTGRREAWKEIPPVSPSTGGGVGLIRFSADGRTCLYTHHRLTAELFVVEGLK
jgi:hypothetical protein